MDSSTSDPLVFLQLLANRKGKLSALKLRLGGGDAELLAPLIEHPDFLNLADQFPCLFLDGPELAFDSELIDVLLGAGWRHEKLSRIGQADRQLEQNYPAGIEWLEGDWYLTSPSKPNAGQVASRALALQLVQLVAADADNREIEAVFRRDPTLSYQLLRLVNSVGIGAGRRITSFSQAIVMLGRTQLRRWLNLMLFAARDGDQRSIMLLARVAVRARAMELLAYDSGLDKSLQEQAFMAGMFSLLGTLFGLPIEQVLRPLMIGEAMRNAVLTREGELGNLLSLLEIAEQGKFDQLGIALEEIQVPRMDFNLTLCQANSWMLSVVRESQGGVNA